MVKTGFRLGRVGTGWAVWLDRGRTIKSSNSDNHSEKGYNIARIKVTRLSRDIKWRNQKFDQNVQQGSYKATHFSECVIL